MFANQEIFPGIIMTRAHVFWPSRKGVSMFFFNLFHPNSFQYATSRFLARSVLALFILSAVLFAGCKMDDNFIDDNKLNSGLIGEWKSEYEGGEELYTITATTLIYSDTYLGVWGGKIVYVSNFSAGAGVLIIEYDADKKQYWTDWDTFADITPSGNFYGIYFSGLKQNSVMLANTSDQKANSGPSETETLQKAIEKFTLGNKGDLTYSGGSAQTRK